MAHVFLQEDPKVSVGDANDVASTIPTPEQLGSLLLTYAATGAADQVAVAYAALAVGGTAQWVPIAAAGGSFVIKRFSGNLTGADDGVTTGYMADTGSEGPMSFSPMGYPAGVDFVTHELTVNVTNNKLTGNTVVTLLKNGVATAIVLSIPAINTGEFSKTGTISYEAGTPDDVFDLRVESTNGGAANTIRMSATLT